MNDKKNQTNEIVPARLKEARVSRGLSLAELAEKIGVTSQAISLYELGISRPSPGVLIKMSNELNFPITFFSKSVISQSSGNSAVNYRSMKSTAKKLKESWGVRISWLHDINIYLRQFVNFPKIDLPSLGDFVNMDEIDPDTIEEVALDLRKHWNIEKVPIPNMVELLQDKGFIISRIEFGEQKIDAFSQWFNEYPYIILGSDKSCAVRSRFDIAHELGHLILHAHIDPETMAQKEVLNRVENEANYFAGAFLLPRDSFPNEVMYKNLDHLLMLKKRWKTSIQAIIKRCQHLEIFSESQVKYLYAQIAQKGYRKKEPLDDVIPYETPYMYKQAIKLLLEHNVISPDQLLYDLALNKEEIDNLCFLSPDILTIKPKRPQLSLITNLETKQA